MYTIERSFEVAVTPEQAFAWLTDLDNLPRFQSGVFGSEILTQPPTRVGTRFRETFRLMGFPMVAECEVIELRPPSVMGFSAIGKRMDYQSRFTIEPVARGARITHRAKVAMHGLWKLLGPMLKAEGGREVEAEHRRLKAAIEGDYDMGTRTAEDTAGRPARRQ